MSRSTYLALLTKRAQLSGSCVTTCATLNSCDWEGCAGSAANISVAPSFVDAGGGDYHLALDSETLNAAVNTVRWYETTVGSDLSDIGRGQGNSWDIGAFEYTD